MKRITTFLLFASLLAVMGTVSYAGDRKPDTPVPKIEKNFSFHAPVVTMDLCQITLEAYRDVGEHPRFEIDVSKKQLEAEKSVFKFCNYRPDRPNPQYQGYTQRSILTRYNSIARPPNVIPLE